MLFVVGYGERGQDVWQLSSCITKRYVIKHYITKRYAIRVYRAALRLYIAIILSYYNKLKSVKAFNFNGYYIGGGAQPASLPASIGIISYLYYLQGAEVGHRYMQLKGSVQRFSICLDIAVLEQSFPAKGLIQCVIYIIVKQRVGLYAVKSLYICPLILTQFIRTEGRMLKKSINKLKGGLIAYYYLLSQAL